MNAKVLGITLLLLFLCVLMSVLVPDTFLKANNIENVVRRTALYGVISIGVAFVIITGGIDLSIGSMVCLTGVLLCLFLDVSYLPYSGTDVLEADKANHTLTLRGEIDQYEVGDRIRYTGGRRARGFIGKIEEITPTEFEAKSGEVIQATSLRLDVPISADEIASDLTDARGKISKVFAITAFFAGDQTQDPQVAPEVTLAGDHSYMKPRDQVTIAHVTDGLKQCPIQEVRYDGGNTVLVLASDIGELDDSWVAMPLERRQRMSVLMALISVLAIAMGFGLLHGLLVTKLKLQPFVVTLCGLLFYRGISRWIVDDQTNGLGKEYDSALRPLATQKLTIWSWTDVNGAVQSFGIPYPFFILIVIAILAAIFLNKTIWGRYMLALGRNEEAARYSGINTDRVTIMAYIICTTLAGVGGILFALDSNSVAPSSHGNFFELYAIAAAVLGGCSLRGGEGGIFGVLIGAAVMRVLYNMITLLKISTTLEFAIIGAVILAGVIADELVRRLATKRRANKSR
jgi:ribose transport system permease protein